MTLAADIPGRDPLRLDFLLLDVNGTLTDRGVLLDGVEERLRRLGDRLDVSLVSADTFGTLDALAERLGVTSLRAGSGEEKCGLVERLGSERCAVVGNGTNDAAALRAAALGIAVLGPEGASGAALASAHAVCR